MTKLKLPNLLNTLHCPLVLVLRVNPENADAVVSLFKA